MPTRIFRGVISLFVGFVLKYFSLDKSKWSKHAKILLFDKTSRWVNRIGYTRGSQCDTASPRGLFKRKLLHLTKDLYPEYIKIHYQENKQGVSW